jgi:hypothetical protein
MDKIMSKTNDPSRLGASGARSDRAQLARVLRALEPGDTLVVTRLDRLARPTRDLLNVLDTSRGAARASDHSPMRREALRDIARLFNVSHSTVGRLTPEDLVRP